MKWAKFEEKQGETALARGVYERAMQELDERDHTQALTPTPTPTLGDPR